MHAVKISDTKYAAAGSRGEAFKIAHNGHGKKYTKSLKNDQPCSLWTGELPALRFVFGRVLCSNMPSKTAGR
jgi:hypothetical protein